MSLYTVEQAVQEARARGLEISDRTFRYYAVCGLLPAPVKGTDDARVRWYPPSVVQRLEDIRSLQSRGWSLRQIADTFAANASGTPARRSDAVLALAVTLRRRLSQIVSGVALSVQQQAELEAWSAAVGRLRVRLDALPLSSDLARRAASWLGDGIASLEQALRGMAATTPETVPAAAPRLEKLLEAAEGKIEAAAALARASLQ